MLMAEPHAWPRLNFERGHGGQLGLRKPPNVVLTEAGVANEFFRTTRDRLLDLGRRQLEICRTPSIEFPAVFPDGLDASTAKLIQQCRHIADRFRIRFE